MTIDLCFQSRCGFDHEKICFAKLVHCVVVSNILTDGMH
jgi:hypothetical protein